MHALLRGAARQVLRPAHAPVRHASALPARTPLQLSLVPGGAWDSHMHVTDPSTFPPSPSATYVPHAALLADAQANAARLHLPNLVFVQPSTYGLDNSCLLHALRAVGPAAGRGVVVFDPDRVTDEELAGWHDAGVRGARVNLQSVGAEMERHELLDVLGRFADRVRPLGGWAIQVFARLEDVAPLLEELVGTRLRGVKFVLDHLGLPSEPSGKRMDDCKGGEVLNKVLRQSEDVYVKVSAPYRMSTQEGWTDLERYTKDLMETRDGRAVVFASDWPHTRFEGLDVMPWIERCVDWCDGYKVLMERLLRDNAKRLWDVSDG